MGTEVSAKYKGAFCEAKVKKVMRQVKCRVTFKQVNITFVLRSLVSFFIFSFFFALKFSDVKFRFGYCKKIMPTYLGK